MTKWIVVGVVVLAAACLTERASAQTVVPVSPQQPLTAMPAGTVTGVPVVTRTGLFGRRRVVTMYYPPVGSQTVIPVGATGIPVSGIQPAQVITPVGAPVVTPVAPVVAPTGPVIVQPTPTYQVRRGLFGRLRYRAVPY